MKKRRLPTESLNRRQWLYIIFLQTIGACVVNAVVNGLVAWLQYRSLQVVELFAWPDTLAGDIVVTTFVEGSLTWMLQGAFVLRDIRIGTVNPLIAKDDALEKRTRCNRFQSFFRCRDLVCWRVVREDVRAWLRLAAGALLRGLCLSLLLFAVYSLPILLILVGVQEGSKPISAVPGAIVFKALFGGAMALLMAPYICIRALTDSTAQYDSHIPSRSESTVEVVLNPETEDDSVVMQ